MSRQGRQAPSPLRGWLAAGLSLLFIGACAPPVQPNYKVPEQTIVLGFVLDLDTDGRPITQFLDDEFRRCQREWTSRPVVWSISQAPLFAEHAAGTASTGPQIGTKTEIAFSDPASGQIVYRFNALQFVVNAKALMITRASPFHHPRLPPLPSRDSLADGTKAWAVNLSNGNTGCRRAN